jgi:membrane protein DedA with SNARE-associated domain/membrane-associated phospholipid phosphatase
VIAGVFDSILHLHGWVAIAVIFAIPALEASAFVGFVFPGEIAVLLGGVLAYQGRISLGAALAAAILGAIVGDSIGYLVGRRWGRSLLQGTIGKVPVIGGHVDKNLDRAENYLQRRGPLALVLGRFTAGLRVLVPGLAGISRMRYWRFLVFNVIGGATWATLFVLLGYFAGAAWHRVAGIASRAGLALLGLIVIGLVVARVARNREGLERFGRRVAEWAPFRWVRRRFPRQVAWLRRRLDPSRPQGFLLTFAVSLAALCAWAFGGLTQDVVGHDEMALVDPKVMRWVAAHRTAWATGLFKTVTWFGSTVVLIPLVLVVGGYFVGRRRDWKPFGKLAAALLGALLLYNIVKPLVARPRPPAAFAIGSFSGWAFPSGHATQSIATWGMLALVTAGMMRRRRYLPFIGATIIVLLVGTSRTYLGAHWLSDVLGGYALGGLWLCLLVSVMLIRARPEGRDMGVEEIMRKAA